MTHMSLLFKKKNILVVLSAGRSKTVLGPFIVCSSTMAARGPEYRAGAGTAACAAGLQTCISTTTHINNGPDMQHTLVSETSVQKTHSYISFLVCICYGAIH